MGSGICIRESGITLQYIVPFSVCHSQYISKLGKRKPYVFVMVTFLLLTGLGLRINELILTAARESCVCACVCVLVCVCGCAVSYTLLTLPCRVSVLLHVAAWL